MPIEPGSRRRGVEGRLDASLDASLEGFGGLDMRGAVRWDRQKWNFAGWELWGCAESLVVERAKIEIP